MVSISMLLPKSSTSSTPCLTLTSADDAGQSTDRATRVEGHPQVKYVRQHLTRKRPARFLSDAQ